MPRDDDEDAMSGGLRGVDRPSDTDVSTDDIDVEITPADEELDAG